MDVAAQVIGFRLMRTKLLAFAVSSFYCGVAGALFAYTYIGTVEPEGFNLDLSFKILFMIIIGGVGSSWVLPRAAFIVLLPIFRQRRAAVRMRWGPASCPTSSSSCWRPDHLFLIVEPHGPAAAVADRQGETAPVAVSRTESLFAVDSPHAKKEAS